jgi:dTDP-glucose 4,6-dehydratase
MKLESSSICKMKSILISGGAGFIGSEFVRHLSKKEMYKRIFVVDKLTYAGDTNRILKEIDSGVCEFIKADVNDTEKYAKALSECQEVVHFAAESHVDNSIKNGLPFIESNILGTFNFLEAIRNYNDIRTVIVSTDEVYGSLENGEADETYRINASSIYSASKASSDLIALANYYTHKQNLSITRCCNNYGPHQNHEKLIPLVINRALRNLPVPVYGNGQNVREWIHVSDHVSAILSVMRNGKPGEIYNIGTGQRISNIEIVNLILSILGKPKSLIEFVNDRKGHDFRYSIASSKISKELEWQPQIDFETGLRTTVEWYENA